LKKLIRKSVWETNSSSCHSVAMATEDKQFVLDTIYPDDEGVITVRGEEFGWQWDRSNDAHTKLSYAYLDGVDEDLLREVVMEQTGATEVVFSKDEGYIDHDSYGTVSSKLHSSEDVRNFVFNKNSWLFLGNDNSSPEPNFYEVPEYRDGKVIPYVYNYQLVIDGVGKQLMFQEEPDTERIKEVIDEVMSSYGLTVDGTLIAVWGWNNAYEYTHNMPLGEGEIRFVKYGTWGDVAHEILTTEQKALPYHEKAALIAKHILESKQYKTISYRLEKI
jgi:hypothetical protein